MVLRLPCSTLTLYFSAPYFPFPRFLLFLPLIPYYLFKYTVLYVLFRVINYCINVPALLVLSAFVRLYDITPKAHYLSLLIVQDILLYSTFPSFLVYLLIQTSQLYHLLPNPLLSYKCTSSGLFILLYYSM